MWTPWKNHGKGLPFQVFMRFAHFLFFLQLAAHIKDGCHFPNTQIMDGNQIFIFKAIFFPLFLLRIPPKARQDIEGADRFPLP